MKIFKEEKNSFPKSTQFYLKRPAIISFFLGVFLFISPFKQRNEKNFSDIDLSDFRTTSCFSVYEEVKVCIGCVVSYILVRTHWRRMNKRINGCWMNEWTERWMNRGIGWSYGRRDAWTYASLRRLNILKFCHDSKTMSFLCLCLFVSVKVTGGTHVLSLQEEPDTFPAIMLPLWTQSRLRSKCWIKCVCVCVNLN